MKDNNTWYLVLPYTENQRDMKSLSSSIVKPVFDEAHRGALNKHFILFQLWQYLNSCLWLYVPTL